METLLCTPSPLLKGQNTKLGKDLFSVTKVCTLRWAAAGKGSATDLNQQGLCTDTSRLRPLPAADFPPGFCWGYHACAQQICFGKPSTPFSLGFVQTKYQVSQASAIALGKLTGFFLIPTTIHLCQDQAGAKPHQAIMGPPPLVCE